MEELELDDYMFSGPLFTWTNNQQQSFLARKLDRVLVTSAWLQGLPYYFVEFLAPGLSDHCCSIIKLDRLSHSPPKPFLFFNIWSKHPDFLSIVENSWQQHV